MLYSSYFIIIIIYYNNEIHKSIYIEERGKVMWSSDVIIETLATIKKYFLDENMTDRETLQYLKYRGDIIEPYIPNFSKNIEKMWYEETVTVDTFNEKMSKYIDASIAYIEAKVELDRISANIKDDAFYSI